MSAIDTNRVHGGTGSFGIGSKIWAAVTAWNDARVTKNAPLLPLRVYTGVDFIYSHTGLQLHLYLSGFFIAAV